MKRTNKNKIEIMYQWSGGTDYRHTCHECENCIRILTGSKTGYKCEVYGMSSGTETDWRPANIACRYYNLPYMGPPVMMLAGKETSKDIPGQISLFDR